MTIDQQLAKEIYERSAQCERGVIVIDPFARMGLAQTAPKSLVWTWIPLDDPRCAPFDLYLN